MQQQRPGFPPRSRHVDSFAPAQSASRPARLSRSFPIGSALAQRRKPRRQRQPRWIKTRLYPACPASLGTLKVSVPPAVKLAADEDARPALDPDIIAAEIVEDLQAALSQF